MGQDLSEALQALARARSSGILTVMSGRQTARFALYCGELLYASSATSPRLGDAIQARGLLTKETLESVLAHQRRKKMRQPLGTILLELDLITDEVVAAELEEQIFSVLSEVLSWERADYELTPLDEDFEGVVLPGCSLETQLSRIAAAANS